MTYTRKMMSQSELSEYLTNKLRTFEGHFYKFPEPATLLTCKRAFLILRTATPV